MTARKNQRERRKAAAKRSRRLSSLPIPWRPLAGAASAVVLAVAVVFLAQQTVAWVKAHPYFQIRAIDIRGNQRLADEEILAFATVGTGQSVWDVSVRRLRMRLKAHPWIHRAEVRRELPGRLIIDVSERVPIAIVRFEDLYFVDRRGHVLGPLAAEDSRNLPIITGLEEEAGRAFAPVALPRTAQLLRWCERRRCIDDISEVHVDRDTGLTMFPMESNVAVQLGWGHWGDKLNRSARVFAAWEGRLDRLSLIDVSFSDVVIVRMREEGEPARSPLKGGRHV